ncbi:MAG TPA: hypothetical protein PKH25_03005, partial [Syntrophales bacterium]|nr:hypothetical protein [Syntrophales bacterium]
MKKRRVAKRTVTLLLAAAAAALLSCAAGPSVQSPTARDDEGARKAFLEASAVLFHPRCVNCHPAGDAPLIRDDGQTHMFNVKRGPEGKGVGAMNC